MTTIFGPDISSYQSGLALARLADAAFVIAKTTEGTYYTDADYQAWRGQAAQLGRPFIWYHFLSGEPAAAQAAHTAANVGDHTLPGMLDFEPAGNFRPTLDQAVAYIDAARGAGLNLRLVYLPHWYWQELGSPDLAAFRARGLSLVSSAYPGGTGSVAHLYPGDGAAGWQSYGGMTPLIYQFTNQASDGGMPLDYNAFRGTVAQLTAALLGTTPIPTPTPGGATVGTIPPSIGQFYPEIAGQFPANASFTDETALIWADAGARAAALYAKQARDAINALAARQAPAPSIDVNALAAALAPHLAAGATADQLAAAVLHHLSADTANG